MKTIASPPFQVGEEIQPKQLSAWAYTGLSGIPGKDKNAVRRFKKGGWVLEVRAHQNRARVTRVVSIRTTTEDDTHWAQTRQRLMRHARAAVD